MPTVGSVCSGIGGLDYGLARAGWEHAFLCEIDPWRRDVLRARFPGVPVYDDIREVAGSQLEGVAAHAQSSRQWIDAYRDSVDLVCGGTPCQDLSVAGRRAGLDGARSGLFFEFARVVDALRPRWLLWENVPGAFSSNGGRDFGAVVGTLADVGYGVGWRALDSRYFGVPQRRRRLFLVGARADGDPRAAAERAGAVLAVGSRCPRHPATRGEAGAELAGALTGGAGGRGWSGDNGAGQGDTLVASLSGLGSGSPDDNDGQAGQLVSYALNAKAGNRDDGESETFVTGPLGGVNDGAGRRSEDDPNLVAAAQTVRRLLPIECERLQALPDGWTRVPDDAPDSRRYAGLGDAVTASVSFWLGSRIMAADRGEL